MNECPICLNVSQADVKLCPVCNWDLSIYQLSPDGLKQEQESRISWSKEVWKELMLLREERESISSEYALKEQWIYKLLKVFIGLEVELEEKCSQKIDLLKEDSSQKLNRLKLEKETLQKELTKFQQIEEQTEMLINYVTSRGTKDIPYNFYVNLPQEVLKVIEYKTVKGSHGKDGQAYWFRRNIIYAVIKQGWLKLNCN